MLSWIVHSASVDLAIVINVHVDHLGRSMWINLDSSVILNKSFPLFCNNATILLLKKLNFEGNNCNLCYMNVSQPHNNHGKKSIQPTAFNSSWISRELFYNPSRLIFKTICVIFMVHFINIIHGDHVEPKTNVKAHRLIFTRFIYTNK